MHKAQWATWALSFSPSNIPHVIRVRCPNWRVFLGWSKPFLVNITVMPQSYKRPSLTRCINDLPAFLSRLVPSLSLSSFLFTFILSRAQRILQWRLPPELLWSPSDLAPRNCIGAWYVSFPWFSIRCESRFVKLSLPFFLFWNFMLSFCWFRFLVFCVWTKLDFVIELLWC